MAWGKRLESLAGSAGQCGGERSQLAQADAWKRRGDCWAGDSLDRCAEQSRFGSGKSFRLAFDWA